MNSKPVVIVTGASRGIGAAVARWLAGTGVAVTLLARSESALRCEAESIGRAGGDSLFLAGDVSEPLFCRSAVATTLDRFHRLDALVNNAGMVEPLSAVADARPADWQYNIAVNLLGAVYMSMAAIGELRGRNGRIVNVSSGAANAVIAAASAYCAAKAALNQFSRQGPGKMPAEQAAFYTDLKTAGRLEPPQVPARAIAWLALHAPREWSGAFMSYDDPRIAEPARATFGGG